MPWKASDAKGHTKEADTEKKQKQWAAVANSALQSCLDKGGDRDECKASAIRQANFVVAEVKESGPITLDSSVTTIAIAWGGHSGFWEYASNTDDAVWSPSNGTWTWVPDPSIEAETETLPMEQDPPDQCECPECGALTDKERGVPCRSVDCPECEVKMVAKLEGEEEVEEYGGSLDSLLTQVRGAFNRQFRPSDDMALRAEGGPSYWVRDTFIDHPTFGNAAVVEEEGILWAVPFEMGEAIEFSPREEWVQVILTYMPVLSKPLSEAGKRMNAAQVANLKAIQDAVKSLLQWADYDDDDVPDEEDEVAELLESASGHILAESKVDGAVPLTLDVALIKPGWGNPRDNHYYPEEVLRRDAKVFVEAKMHESDHRPDEKSTRTWVSTVKSIKGFTDDGTPIAEVVVHEPSFAERLTALSKADLLHRMECSILATGTAKKGTVDGRRGKVVEAITLAESVDWVTKAGAGGRALSLSETEEGAMGKEKIVLEEQEAEKVKIEETMLPEDAITEALDATHLPEISKDRLRDQQYPDQDALAEAITAEVEYVKEVTGSGRPFAQGGSSSVEPMTDEEFTEQYEKIAARHGLRR